MSKNHIKIFDDTVLKQSINQGTESQRSAPNLGRFTMGELAFTRDTGRVFVGTSSSQNPSSQQLPEVQGGILTGNKYLGYIDSKPLSWWKRGEYSSIPLNYDSETYYKDEITGNESKDDFTMESSMLGKDSKYRNRPNYTGKWQREAIYNEKYDAYNGDYLYDIYQNAIILFDTNISEKSNNISGVSDMREQFYDNDGTVLSIDEQYRRTKVQNLVDDYNKSRPIYGDGYVIFKNIEVDGKTIKFKDKVFNNNGEFPEDGHINYSHNVIEVGEIGSSSMIGALSKEHFINNSVIELRDTIKGIHGISNTDNTFTLPQIITFTSDPNNTGGTLPSTLDLRYFNSKSTINDDDYSIKISPKTRTLTDGTKQELSGQYSVSIAKHQSPEFYIRLDSGLSNIGGGASDYIKISKETAGSLGESCPKISLSSNDNLTFEENDLNDPFYTLYESESGNFYNGNMTINSSGYIQMIDDYDDDYKQETTDERAKFESDKNIKVNMLKNPIPIMWTGKHSQINESDEEIISNDKFDANLEYIIKPYFYCINKEVGLNGTSTTTSSTNTDGEKTFTSGDSHNNTIIVLGNNHYEAKNKEGSYFIIPGFNCEIDTSLPTNKNGSTRRGGEVLKCTFDSISIDFNENVKCGQYNEEIIDGVNEITVFDETILTEDLQYNSGIFEKLTSQIGTANPIPELLSDINTYGYDSNETPLSNYFFETVNVDDIPTDKLENYIKNNIENDKLSKYFSFKNSYNTRPIFDFNVRLFTEDSEDSEKIVEVSSITENVERVSFVKSDSYMLKVNLVDGATIYDTSDFETSNNIGTVLLDTTDETTTKKSILNNIDKLEKKIAHIKDVYTKHNGANPEGEQLTLDEETVTYYDKTNTLVWSKIVEDESNFYYVASLYQNSHHILGESSVPVALRITFEDEGDVNEIVKTYSLKKLIPYYKSFTIYKKPIPSTNLYYYTIAKEDSITNNDQKRYIAQVIYHDNSGNTTLSPDDFWNKIIKNEKDKIKIDERTGVQYAHIDIGDTDFFGQLSTCDNITFVIAVEKEFETDSSKYYKKKKSDGTYEYFIGDTSEDDTTDDGTTEEDDIEQIDETSPTVTKGPAPGSILETTFDIESFVLPSVCWSDNGYHTPVKYDTNADDSITDEMTVVVPDHANEIILEVRHQTESGNPIAIFAAKDASLLTDVVVENNATSDFNAGFTANESAYGTNGKLIIPSFVDNNTNFMLPNSNEKCLLYSDSNEVSTIRVPLYRSKYESGKMFALRVSGVKASDTEKLMIRLIGYSL